MNELVIELKEECIDFKTTGRRADAMKGLVGTRMNVDGTQYCVEWVGVKHYSDYDTKIMLGLIKVEVQCND